MKYKIANLTLVGSLVILACAQGIIESVSAQANACPSTYITVQNAIDVPGEYSVWLEQNKPSNDSSLAYISGDEGNSCTQFNSPDNSDTWSWTRLSDANKRITIGEDTSQFRVYISDGALKVSKLLFTLDGECVPTGDGTNCVEEPLDFSIVGLNKNVSGSPVVETVLSNSSNPAVRVEFYFDEASTAFSTSTTAPYCLVLTDSDCAGWPSESLSDGKHSLTVRAISESGVTEKTLEFTINNSEETSSPTPTPPSPATEETTTTKPTTNTKPTTTKPENQNSEQNNTNTDSNEPASTQPAPSPSPSPTPQPTSNASSTPSQSTTIPQYTYYAPSATPTNNSQTPQTSNTSNQSTTTKNTKTVSPVKSAVVAGLNLKGDISGTVVVAAPKNISLSAGDKLELLVSGKTIDTIDIESKDTPTSFSFDTTKIKNGSAVLSMRVTKKSGEIATYSSTVNIQNNKVAATTGKVKSRWSVYVLSTLVILGIIFGGIYAVRHYKQTRSFEYAHNTMDYTYVQPENPYTGYAGASMAIIFAATAVFFFAPHQSYAANIGHIYRLSESTLPSNATTGVDADATISYVAFEATQSSEEPPTTPEPAPSPTTPTPTPTPLPSTGNRLFMFGDSLTVGMAANGLLPIFNETGFSVDTEYTDNSGEFIGNSIRAKGGWKLSDVEAVVDSHKDDLASANYIVVAIGTNDSPITENYDVRMVAFMNTLKGYSPNAKIFWVNTFFVDDGQWWVIQDGQLLHVYTNPVIAAGVASAKSNGIDATLIDFEGAIGRGEMIPPDGDYVHYSNQGSQTQARWLAGAVKSAIESQ